MEKYFSLEQCLYLRRQYFFLSHGKSFYANNPDEYLLGYVDMLRRKLRRSLSRQLPTEENKHSTEIPLHSISHGENPYFVQQNTRTAGTKRRLQGRVTGHRKLNNNLDTPLGFSCLFVSFPVTSQSGICLAATTLSVLF